MVVKYISILLLISLNVYCQNKNQIELMPNKNIFPALKANPFEARIGLQYYPSNGYFKVDAGHEVDILSYTSAGNTIFTFGSMFFMQGLGLNIKEKRLPIDAADGYFGLTFAYSDTVKNFKARMRILHNSAHLVDGHLERNLSFATSLDYAKDFVELTVMNSFNTGIFDIEYYGGGSYSIVIHPKNLKRYTLHGGLQLSSQNLNTIFEKPVNLFCAYHFSLTSVPAFIGNNNLTAGIRFGNWESSALTIYISYYSGGKLFNQYYDQREKEFSIGFYLE